MVTNPLKKKVRPSKETEHYEHEYDAEAKRVLLVDIVGDNHDKDNPLPVDAIINLSSTNPNTPNIINLFNIF